MSNQLYKPSDFLDNESLFDSLAQAMLGIDPTLRVRLCPSPSQMLTSAVELDEVLRHLLDFEQDPDLNFFGPVGLYDFFVRDALYTHLQAHLPALNTEQAAGLLFGYEYALTTFPLPAPAHLDLAAQEKCDVAKIGRTNIDVVGFYELNGKRHAGSLREATKSALIDLFRFQVILGQHDPFLAQFGYTAKSLLHANA